MDKFASNIGNLNCILAKRPSILLQSGHLNASEVDMNEVEEAASDIAKVRQHFVKMTTHAGWRLQLGIEFVISSS